MGKREREWQQGQLPGRKFLAAVYGVGDVLPTTYTFTETSPSGWTTTSVSCSVIGTGTGSGSTTATTGTATIALNQGDITTCVFTNTIKAHTVTLNKVVVPSGDAGTFALTAGTCSGTTKSGGQSLSCASQAVFSSIAVGETGTNLANYTSTLTCSGVSIAANSTTSATFGMPDNDVTCTLTNTRIQRTVTLTKVLFPATDAGLFMLSIAGTESGTKTASTALGLSLSDTTVYGGDSVTVSETGIGTSLSSYTSTLNCGSTALTPGGTTSGSFTMPDADVTCTLTNNRLATLAIQKICAAGTTESATTFTGNVGISRFSVACGARTSPIPLSPATYTVTEDTLTGWTTPVGGALPLPIGWTAPRAFAGDCDSTGHVSLAYGDNKTCYIVNVSASCTPSVPSAVSDAISVAPQPDSATIPAGRARPSKPVQSPPVRVRK